MAKASATLKALCTLCSAVPVRNWCMRRGVHPLVAQRGQHQGGGTPRSLPLRTHLDGALDLPAGPPAGHNLLRGRRRQGIVQQLQRPRVLCVTPRRLGQQVPPLCSTCNLLLWTITSWSHAKIVVR